jgi:hypothetical protein
MKVKPDLIEVSVQSDLIKLFQVLHLFLTPTTLCLKFSDQLQTLLPDYSNWYSYYSLQAKHIKQNF